MKTFDYGLYKPSEALLLVIDVQEKLTPLMSEEERLIKNVNTLLRGAEILGIPTLITEQYPKGLGHTDKRIEFERDCTSNESGENANNIAKENANTKGNGVHILEKTSFSIFGNAKIVDFITQLNAPQLNMQSGARNLIICGIESHICVLQSVLHALELDLKVWVAQDALSSRTKDNHLNAIELMRSQGANISCVESLLFGAMLESKHECFKQISTLIK